MLSSFPGQAKILTLNWNSVLDDTTHVIHARSKNVVVITYQAFEEKSGVDINKLTNIVLTSVSHGFLFLLLLFFFNRKILVKIRK